MAEEIMNLPPDCAEMTKQYTVDKGGICGQACISVIEEKTIKGVLDTWKNIGLEFKGYSTWKQLRKYLVIQGYKVKQVCIKSTLTLSHTYIARVQWRGKGDKQDKPFYGWGHWSEASAHTHFILLRDEQFFCNESGILHLRELDKYLEDHDGLITSCLEITKLK